MVFFEEVWVSLKESKTKLKLTKEKDAKVVELELFKNQHRMDGMDGGEHRNEGRGLGLDPRLVNLFLLRFAVDSQKQWGMLRSVLERTERGVEREGETSSLANRARA